MTTRLVSSRLAAQLSRRVAGYSYNDRAKYYPEPDLDALDDAGQPIVVTTYEEVECNFTDKVSSESWSDIADTESIEAEIRLQQFKPDKAGKFELFRKFGVDLDVPETFQIVGIKTRGQFGYVCALKKVVI